MRSLRFDLLGVNQKNTVFLFELYTLNPELYPLKSVTFWRKTTRN